MITGAKFWDKDYYDQKNNAFEQQNLLKYGEKIQVLQKDGTTETIHYTETCGPSAAINCLCALGYDLRIYTVVGVVNVQPEDLLTCWMYQNKKYLLSVNDGVECDPPNRVLANYVQAANQLFKAYAEFIGPFTDWDKIVKLICNGGAVQMLIPGHYIAAVAYDSDTNEIIYKDSFYGNNKRMDSKYYIEKVAQYYVHYFPKV